MDRLFRESSRYIIALALALLVGSALIVWNGDNPLEVYRLLFKGAVGTGPNLLRTIRWSSALMLSGLANVVAFREQVWNIGVEGQILAGALASAVAGYGVEGLPGFFHILLALLAGALGGALWALIPAILYVRFRLNEIVTTIMMNYIVVLLTEYLVRYYLHEPYDASSGIPNWVATPEVLESAKLPILVPPYQANASLFIGIGIALILFCIYRYFVLGYEADMVGLNLRFAHYGGVRTSKVLLVIFLCSGALGGITGASEILGAQYRFTSVFTKGLGFDGIMVALLARNAPLGTIPAGFFMGGLRNGAYVVERLTETNRATITVIQALILLFFTMRIWLPRLRKLLGRRN